MSDIRGATVRRVYEDYLSQIGNTIYRIGIC